MKMSALPFAGFKRLLAFTLVELLVVIAIILIVIALVTPAVLPVLRSSRINAAASMIVDEFNLSRQLALAQNCDVEVRFYRLGSKSDASDKQFRAFRSFVVNGSDPAKSKPLSKVRYLPEPVIVSGDGQFSTLLDYANANRVGLSHSQEALNGVPGQSEYVSFLFRATGGTNLSPVDPANGGNWFLTVFLENAPKTAATGIPSNYFTAQVDPITGRVRTYRP